MQFLLKSIWKRLLNNFREIATLNSEIGYLDKALQYQWIWKLRSFLLIDFHITKNRWICKLSKSREEVKKIVILLNLSSIRRM